tara:strand:+ start:592 stop:1890 length:1299 start_codon:yes stop_codon:yes gene_type:complete
MDLPVANVEEMDSDLAKGYKIAREQGETKNNYTEIERRRADWIIWLDRQVDGTTVAGENLRRWGVFSDSWKWNVNWRKIVLNLDEELRTPINWESLYQHDWLNVEGSPYNLTRPHILEGDPLYDIFEQLRYQNNKWMIDLLEFGYDAAYFDEQGQYIMALVLYDKAYNVLLRMRKKRNLQVRFRESVTGLMNGYKNRIKEINDVLDACIHTIPGTLGPERVSTLAEINERERKRKYTKMLSIVGRNRKEMVRKEQNENTESLLRRGYILEGFEINPIDPVLIKGHSYYHELEVYCGNDTTCREVLNNGYSAVSLDSQKEYADAIKLYNKAIKNARSTGASWGVKHPHTQKILGIANMYEKRVKEITDYLDEIMTNLPAGGGRKTKISKYRKRKKSRKNKKTKRRKNKKAKNKKTKRKKTNKVKTKRRETKRV